MADDPTTLTTAQLEAKLESAVTLQRTVLIIFGVIVLAWIVLGYWRTNTLVFIVTLATSVAVSASTVASRRGLRREIARRAAGE